MPEITSPVKAIRAHCLDCAYTAQEVKLCPIVSCALYPFRFGKNPYHKPQLSDEQRAAKAERARRMHAEEGVLNDERSM